MIISDKHALLGKRLEPMVDAVGKRRFPLVGFCQGALPDSGSCAAEKTIE